MVHILAASHDPPLPFPCATSSSIFPRTLSSTSTQLSWTVLGLLEWNTYEFIFCIIELHIAQHPLGNMAKQSSLFNFFTKSPPLAVKAKSNPSPVEADAVSRSNTSPKEEAKVNSKKTPSKPVKSQAKAGHAKLFGEKADTAKERYSNCNSICAMQR